MAKFPEPPGLSDLQRLKPAIKLLETGTRMYRIFRSGGDHPMGWNAFRFFGPTSARFDHHLVDSQGEPEVAQRGIMYCAAGEKAVPTCLAEVFQGTKSINRRDGSPVLCVFTLTAPLSLIDLSGPFATKIGASTAISSGSRIRAQRWAQQLYDAFPEAEGIYSGSSMYGYQPAIALFERSVNAIPTTVNLHRQLDDPELKSVIVRTAWDIGYTVVDIDDV